MSGISCKECGLEDTQVIDSRQSRNSVVRRRKCLNCNAVFKTFEVSADFTFEAVEKLKNEEFQNLKTEINKEIEKMIDAVKKLKLSQLEPRKSEDVSYS